MLFPFSEVSSYIWDGRLCLLPRAAGTDDACMTVTAEHIYNKACDECERPALTFDRDHRAFCPTHASSIVRADPVENEIPVTNARSVDLSK
jgi:hypothetical protein